MRFSYVRVALAVSIASSGISQNVIGTFAGTSFFFPSTPLPALASPLGHVQDVAVDSVGQIYASDRDNNIVVRIALDGTLSVYAGNGLGGFSGEGGQATHASLNVPVGLAIDPSGNVYVADSLNNRVRRVAPDGSITTYAGTGVPGYGGDGGPAVSGRLNTPLGIAFDVAGNLYIADSLNNRVRRVTPSGMVSTFAGNGQAGSAGDGGAALAAQLNSPAAVALDSLGNVYIATVDRVRKVAPNGSISTVTGGISIPSGLATDGSNALYISDSYSNSIYQVAPGGKMTTIAGTGSAGFAGDGLPATVASLANPGGLAVSPSGVVHIADRDNLRLRRIDTTGIIQTEAGNGNFLFSGDGQPATTANLSGPAGVAADSLGDIFIADLINDRIREVTTDGILRTVAGNGTFGYSGNNGPATGAALAGPESVIVNGGGFYIADRSNNVVRRVDLQNIITTIAGGGQSVGVGDGGPATKATLQFPFALALDSSGNLYIADTNNDRIRKVAPDMTISTVAGGGNSTADGVLATDAQLNAPQGVAVDAQNRIYISDTDNDRIRVVSNGVITTFVGSGSNTGENVRALSAFVDSPRGLAVDASGNLYYCEYNANRVRTVSSGEVFTIAGVRGPGAFGGDGGPAVSASLNGPVGIAFDGQGNLYIADSNNNRVRVVLAAPPNFQIQPTALSFSTRTGGAPPAPQFINVVSSIPGLPLTVSSDSSWLSSSVVSGSTPAQLQVTVDATQFAVGTYTGTITVSAPNAAPPVKTVSVTFDIQPPIAPELGVNAQSLGFSSTQGAGDQTRQFQVLNLGVGSLDFIATATTTSGGSWLAVSPGAGTSTPSSPVPLSVTMHPQALLPGTYLGNITISGGGSTVTVPVTVSQAASNAVLLLSQNGLTFRAVEQGGSPLSQSIAILNTGQGSVTWSATATTLSGGGWLTISPNNGTLNQPDVDVSSVMVSVNPAGLPQGDYYGQIVVNANAINAPQFVTVILTVSPAGTNLGPEIQPSSLTFTSLLGQTPGSQDVLLGNSTGQSLSYVSSFTGAGFSFLPTSAVVPNGQSATLRVYPDFSNIPAGGVGRATITLQFSDKSVRDIQLLAVTTPGPAVASQANRKESVASCTDSTLIQPTTLTDPSGSVTLLHPATLQVQVVDNCGNAITSQTGAVLASFSNNDAPVNLLYSGVAGTWTGTWTPRDGSQPRVTIQYTAFSAGSNTASTGQARLSISLQAGGSTPVTFAAINAASGTSSFVAPGSLIAIYGQQLADQSGQPQTLPFPTSLNGTQVLLGGKPLPLRYVSGTQLNAQVPFDLPINSTQQLIVVRGTTMSVPQDVIVAAADPAVYTVDGSGTGAGLIVNTQYQLLTGNNPPMEGDVIIIYANGLGPLSPPVATGTAAPLDGTLLKTAYPVNVNIGGLDATIAFAGLVPGYPDLYQVNAVVPCHGSDSTSVGVPVMLTVASIKSRGVTMPRPGRPGGSPGVQCVSQ